ncbi:GntR family transcriptional regulator [Paraburkholderia sp. RG36]|uniref:GntR family transcriptional regulator n=2 Tax=Paraburkholderia tagetis TaxID=2913261 RepID=A0A9X1UP63_9BURK|nr:GntR family transcriptional regulator [Paraburkholderia tagetis]
MIVTLEFPPGALLSEPELGKRLGVSRTPVGEALQRLAREGLVTILPRRGIVVSEISVSDQLRLLELRREISRFIARMGAMRASDEERLELRQVARAFQEAAAARDTAALMSADKTFHDLFAACAHNSFAYNAINSMEALMRRFWYAHSASEADFIQSSRLHAELARAVAKGDETAAAAASDALSDYCEDFVRTALDRPRPVASVRR